jgi:hypothetical protein
MSQNSRNQGFSYYICFIREGSGSIPLTNGSGSGRPKNTWIRWIRIRIRNTAIYSTVGLNILSHTVHNKAASNLYMHQQEKNTES